MTYEEFVTEYENLLSRLMAYKPDTIAHNEFSSKLADLVEDYPDFEERYDNE